MTKTAKPRPRVEVDSTGIKFNDDAVSLYRIVAGGRLAAQIDEESRTVTFSFADSSPLTVFVSFDFKIIAFRNSPVIRRGTYSLRRDGDCLFFRWQAKRPPRPRCAICGNRFYDYRRKGDRICRQSSCRSEARSLEARAAYKSSKTPDHLSHQPINAVKLAGSFGFEDHADPRSFRPMSYEIRSVNWKRRRRGKDPEIEALKKADAFRRWREKNPERAREVQRESFKRYAERKIAEDPDWRRKRYEKYVKSNPEQMEKARRRARERYRRLKAEAAKTDD